MKNKTDLLNFIASEIGAKTYLEIGEEKDNFDNVNIENKYRNDLDNTYDLILIDGDHSYEASKKDLESSLKILNEGGVVVMHDAFPSVVGLTGVKKSNIAEWCGDVYKTVMWARQQPDLGVITWGQDYGCAIITKGELKATDKPKIDLTYENLHKSPIDSVGLVNTNELREYFSIFKEVAKISTVEDTYDSMSEEDIKAEYKDKFPKKRIGRKSLQTLIRELRNS